MRVLFGTMKKTNEGASDNIITRLLEQTREAMGAYQFDLPQR